MQTFSNMRRNSSHKKTLLSILLFLGLYVYESIVSMQMWLPPFIGICLGLFIRFDKQDNFYALFAIMAIIILLEAENNLPVGMLLGLFLVLSLIVIPRLQTILNTPSFAWSIHIFSAYSGFYILAFIIDMLTGSTITPSMWIILYYIIFEIIVAIFL